MLLTPRQAAHFAQVDEQTVRRWIKEGRLPVIVPDTDTEHIRIHGGDFASFLAGSRVKRQTPRQRVRA